MKQINLSCCKNAPQQQSLYFCSEVVQKSRDSHAFVRTLKTAKIIMKRLGTDLLISVYFMKLGLMQFI